MTTSLANLKHKPGRRQLNPVELRNITEESWITYPNKLKILLDIYGGQQESDKQVNKLHDSIAEFDNARSRKINAGLIKRLLHVAMWNEKQKCRRPQKTRLR